MNCFNHRAVPAVGLCKSCGKALCGDCLTELTNGLACKGKCESRVNMLNRMVDSSAKRLDASAKRLDASAKILSAARQQMRSVGLFCLLMGIGFDVFAVWAYFETAGFVPYFIGLAGAFMSVLGLALLRGKERFPQPADAEGEKS